MIAVQPGQEPLTLAQSKRLDFYITVLRFVRNTGGSVDIALPIGSKQAAAVSLWLPPRIRPSLLALVRAGFLSAVYQLAGHKSLFRLWNYEKVVEKLFNTALLPLGRSQTDGAYLQMLGTDPDQAGNGYAEQLLRWQIEEHKNTFPHTPIYLETNKCYAQKIYERVGFCVLASQAVSTGTDADGFQRVLEKDKSGVDLEKDHIVRVMVYKVDPPA